MLLASCKELAWKPLDGSRWFAASNVSLPSVWDEDDELEALDVVVVVFVVGKSGDRREANIHCLAAVAAANQIAELVAAMSAQS